MQGRTLVTEAGKIIRFKIIDGEEHVYAVEYTDGLPEPKLGRWIYCKYCYKNVLPKVHLDLVICSVAGCGLAPYDEVRRLGSYAAWHDGICSDFHAKYPVEPRDEGNAP